MNDFMYKLLREESYNAQLDEVIGEGFIDYRQSKIGEGLTITSPQHKESFHAELQEHIQTTEARLTHNSMTSEDRKSLEVRKRFDSYINGFDY